MKSFEDSPGARGRPMVVGLVSDTHGPISPQALAALVGCDHIIHAGDIGGPSILRDLEALAPVTAVLGNNDYDEYGAAVGWSAAPVVGGVRFLVAHYPRDVRTGHLGAPCPGAGGPVPQVCVHGHTHVPELVRGEQARPADYMVCPGALRFPRSGFPRCTGRVAVCGGRVLGVRIASLGGETVFEEGVLPDEESSTPKDRTGRP